MLIPALASKLKPLTESFGSAKEITGVTTGSKSFLAAACFYYLGKTICFITSEEERAAQLADEAKLFLNGTAAAKNIFVFYEKEEFENQRLNVLDSIMGSDLTPTKNLIITSVKAVLQKTVSKNDFNKIKLPLKRGEKHDLKDIIKKLVDYGYEKNYLVSSRGEFSLRGYILDIFPLNFSPVRIEFLYDAVESIKTFDPVTQRSSSIIDSVNILPVKEIKAASSVIDYLPDDAIVILDEPSSLKLHILEYLDELNIKKFDVFGLVKNKKTLTFTQAPEREKDAIKLNLNDIYSFSADFPRFYEKLNQWSRDNKTTVIISSQYKRLKDVLAEENIPRLQYETPMAIQDGQNILINGKIKNGFMFPDLNLAVVGDTELFSSIYRPREITTIPQKVFSPRDKINIGDFVVHKNYGISKFLRLQCMEIEGNKKDYIVLEFDKGAKLYHPFDQMDLLEKYLAPEGSQIKLSLLGGALWKKTRARIKEDVKIVAKELLLLYAHRQKLKGHKFSADTVWLSELEAAFPYEETPDQLEAIKSVKEDMESEKVTDRLICGDAGFGKTEVALRAAFKAALDGKQTAFLVPTTVLAEQHYNTFFERLSTFPVKVNMLSRFKSKSEQKQIIKNLEEGKTDIIIGTHRLLQKDIKFKDLGLLIIDEEQHFGVKQKEFLKDIKKNVDCISLTATPIPRTFQMIISGIKDLSVINTAPQHRLPVKTYLFEYNKDIIKGAILRELARGGQVFYLTDRVQGIEKEADFIQKLAPFAKIAASHGQMNAKRLEKTMYEFTAHKFDILVCTSIIESGLDIPEANTIIVKNAQNFGLSQLYQIRGRVGRRVLQSFAYFLYPKNAVLNSEAMKRLETLKEFSDLGSGFQIALKDLEIRGAGNLLGTSQHGFIEAVGFNEYCRLIKEAVSELRGEEAPPEKISPAIDIPLQAFIPNEYIADKEVKLDYYKRLAEFTKPAELLDLKKEFIDMFGAYPVEVENLFTVISLRILAIKHNIAKIKMIGNSFNIIGFNTRGVSVKLLYGLSNKYAIKIYLSSGCASPLPRGDELPLLVIEGLASRANWLETLDNLLQSITNLAG